MSCCTSHTYLGVGLTVESRACDWAGGWVCLREGSWGMCPPVWMCLSRSGCGCTKRPVCVVCWRTRAHSHQCLLLWLLAQSLKVCIPGAFCTQPQFPYLLYSWGGEHRKKLLDKDGCSLYHPVTTTMSLACPIGLTHLFAFPKKVLMTSGPQGQAQVSLQLLQLAANTQRHKADMQALVFRPRRGL